MPRMLNDLPCEVTFRDNISNSEITLQYRLPTTAERVAYGNSAIIRRGKVTINNLGATRLKYGAAIITGFQEGAFATEKGVLSPDPQSPHYDPDWKNKVMQFAPEIIQVLAMRVFENSLEIAPASEEEEEEAIPPDPS